MSAPQTSLINPLDPSEVLLFYLNGKGNVALHRHSFANGKYNATTFDDYGVPTGPDFVASPSSLTALMTNDMMSVFSLIREPAPKPSGDGDSAATPVPAASGEKKSDDASSNKRIAQLIPVPKLITGGPTLGKANGIALTSTIDNNGQAWLYNIVVKDNSPAINEIKLEWGECVQGRTICHGLPLLATNLAATYDPIMNKKLVVYQNKKALRFVDSAGNGDNDIPNTTDSLDSTGLALVTVKTDLGVKLYLYYFSSKGTYLQRVIRSENGTWGNSSEVPNAKQGEKKTFLSATQVGDKIAVFYITPEDQKAFYIFTDTIA